MKKIIFGSLFVILSLTTFAQSLTKKLQSKPWFVRDYLFHIQQFTISSDSTKNDGELTFLRSGRIYWHAITKTISFDSEGNKYPAGLILNDSTCYYEIKKNIVKITRFVPKGRDHEEINFSNYFKIEELFDKTGYKFIFAKETEFK